MARVQCDATRKAYARPPFTDCAACYAIERRDEGANQVYPSVPGQRRVISMPRIKPATAEIPTACHGLART